MAVTGTLLVYKPQLKALAAPRCGAGAPRPLAEALPAIDREFPGQVRMVVPASSDLCLHEVIFRESAGGAYVDPATLQVAQTWGPTGRPTDLLLELHRHLLLQERGKLPTSVFAVAILLLASMGLALALRRPSALSLRLWPLAKSPGALLASHRNIGMLLALPLAFMAASGWALTYPKAAQDLLARALGEGAAPRTPALVGGKGPALWGEALATAKAAFPGLEPRVVAWPGKPGQPITFRFRQAGEWALKGQSSALVTPTNGRLVARIDARRASRSVQLWGSLHPLHTGHLPPRVGVPLVTGVGVATGLALCVAIWASSLRALRRRSRRGTPAEARAQACDAQGYSAAMRSASGERSARSTESARCR